MNIATPRKLTNPAMTAIKGLDFLSPAADLAARLWLADVFWKSGLTKIANWQTTQMLFNFEYHVPLLSPNVAAPYSPLRLNWAVRCCWPSASPRASAPPRCSSSISPRPFPTLTCRRAVSGITSSGEYC